MDSDGFKEQASYSGHRFNGTNYRLWNFQLDAFMRTYDLSDNIEGMNVPDKSASAEQKSKYNRKEGRAMDAIIRSLDTERANLVLSCKTAKEMIDRIKSMFERNSTIIVMNLYEEYFSLKMKEDESIIGYISKVNYIASEIESQGEQLSDNLKMCRIISSLTSKFNHYKTVWYNTQEIRTLDTMMSSLQLEEDNLKKNDVVMNGELNVAFAAKTWKSNSKQKGKFNIDELKKKTKCKICDVTGHWARECPNKNASSSNVNTSSNKNASSNKNKKKNGEMAFIASDRNCNKNDSWIADSGASKHMSYRLDWFSEYRKYFERLVVKIANNEELTIHGIGTILIEAEVNGQWESRRLENVLHVPDLKSNLFSTVEVTNKGFNVLFTKDGCKLLSSSGDVVAIGKKDEENQIKMSFRKRIDEHANVAAVSLQQWHKRLGHINVESIKQMCNKGLVNGINLSDCDKFFCEDCQLGKMTRASHKSAPQRTAMKGEFLHADLCGPMETEGVDGSKYFLLIKDESTAFRYVYLLKSKDEVYGILTGFIPLVQNTIGNCIKHIRFDNGTEFVNKQITNLLRREGITCERISPYTPEQNGRIERDNRTVQESARTMLIASGLEKFLWPEAVRTAIYMLNRSPNSKCIGSTPYEKWFGSKPDLSHVKIFGTECFVQIPKQLGRKKWDPKAKKVHLVGFEPTTKNFRLFDPKKRNVFINCNVRFNEAESKTFVIETYSGDIKSDNDEEQKDEFSTRIENQQADLNSTRTSQHNKSLQNSSIMTEDDDKVANSPENEKLRGNERYNLRPKTNTPDRLIETGYSAVVCEPLNYNEAVCSSEQEQWKKAIEDELCSLKENGTWKMVKRPANANVIGCKWVFKLKQNADGVRYKARLVAKGYSQREGIDFNETFSPVVRHETIRMMLSIAAIEDYEIMQFDVKTAFLYGDLEEQIYMKIPEGVKIDEKLKGNDAVCLLLKSLYGLKQASRTWNQKFTNFLRNFKMKQSNADHCVFTGEMDGYKVILILYVDDGLVLSESKEVLIRVKERLSRNFSITEGYERHYVGIQFERDRENKKIFIHQTEYIKKLIEKYEMGNCNILSTPADVNVVLNKSKEHENELFPYRQAVGSLLYLSKISRPDISYAVGAVSRYLENPSAAHTKAVKRIIRYLKGTIDFGIEYGGSSVVLKGYTDADYARDVDNRRSTSGYVCLINDSIVTWRSRLQRTVAASTTEAEYIAIAEGIKEILWLRQLLNDVGYKQNSPTPVFIDNQSAILLTKNAEFHQRTKYIDVDYHFSRYHIIEKKNIEPQYVSTNDQLADVLTKPLAAQKFNGNIRSFGMKNLGETISGSVEN